MTRHSVAAAAAFLLLTAAGASAQGTLGGQGFGYPPGQLSTLARGSGGALGEFDPLSALNPAALAVWGPAGLHLEYEPEFRRTTAGGQSARSSQSRFPLLGASIPLGSRLQAGVSASTLLDRTWETADTRLRQIGVDTVTATSRYQSSGAVNDLRVAVAYAPAPWLALGLAGHALTGENRLVASAEFPAESRFGNFSQSEILTFSGQALSAGTLLRFGKAGQLAASYRYGGAMRVRTAGDSVLASSRVPDRAGVALRLDAITGATFAARLDWQGWSKLGPLLYSPAAGDTIGVPIGGQVGRPATTARDALEVGVGADVAGPRVGGSVIVLRVGLRARDLPFSTPGTATRVAGGVDVTPGAKVRETTVAGGLGLPFGYGRAALDLSVQRARRTTSAPGALGETAWLVGVGLTVRP